MPVTKTNGLGLSRGKSSTKSHDCCFTKECSTFLTKEPVTEDFGRKILWTLFGILLAYLVVLVGTLIRNNLHTFNFIGRVDRADRTITIEAEGKVTAKPDVAVVTMGMVAEGKDLAKAQEKNTTVINSLIEKLKGLGILPENMQTASYNIYPQYSYTEKEQKLTGYEVRQEVTIKIRDLTKASSVLSLVGVVGANSVSNLQFTNDDREVYIAEARRQALEKVRQKAEALSNSLGVELDEVISYNEFESVESLNEFESAQSLSSVKDYRSDFLGVGGSPTVEPGSMEVVLNVGVTFGIR